MTEGHPQEPMYYHLRLTNGQAFGPGTIEQICQWASEGRVPRDAVLDPVGEGRTVSVMAVPAIARVLSAPPTVHAGPPAARATPSSAPRSDGGMSALIPYRNKPALIGYYFGVASLIPMFGIGTGIVAIILGIMGIVQRKRQPESRGLAHAIVAIVLGIGGPLLWVLLIVWISSQGGRW